MSKFDKAQDRALELIGEIGDGLRKHVPDKAMQLIGTGTALGAMKTGARVATNIMRRNPVLAGAAVVGAGLLWYAARRRAKQAELAGTGQGTIEGTATRIDPKPPRKRASSASNARTPARKPRAQTARS